MVSHCGNWNSKKQRIEWWFLGWGGGAKKRGNREMLAKGHKLSVIRSISSGDVKSSRSGDRCRVSLLSL
jgi:hypothetical protein